MILLLLLLLFLVILYLVNAYVIVIILLYTIIFSYRIVIIYIYMYITFILIHFSNYLKKIQQAHVITISTSELCCLFRRRKKNVEFFVKWELFCSNIYNFIGIV